MINKINPLYTLLLLFTITLITFFMLGSYQEEFEDSSKRFNDTKALAKVYSNLKTNWDDDRNNEQKIDKLINSTQFRNSAITKNKQGKSVEVIIVDNNPDTISNFLSKLLNEKLQINKLSIDSNKVAVEISL